MAKKTKKVTKKQLSIRTAIIFILVVAIIGLIYWYILPTLLNKEDNQNQIPEFKENIEGSIANDGELKMHMISVSQADAIFFEFPTGETMLIDAGEKSTANTVIEYIENLGYTSIDYVLLTHQDSDHAGGMVAIYDAFDVSYSLRPACFSTYKNASNLSENFNIGYTESGYFQSTSATYYNYLKAVQDEETNWAVFNKDSYLNFSFSYEDELYECTLDFLTPTADIGDIKYKEPNNFSPIIMMEYAGCKILLTGDAEKEVEEELLTYYEDMDLDVDVLKVGHHGSKTSSSDAFIKRIAPEYSLISCGLGDNKNNKCPWQVTLDTLVKYQSAIYRTDCQGNIVLTVNINGDIDVNPEIKGVSQSLILTGYSN